MDAASQIIIWNIILLRFGATSLAWSCTLGTSFLIKLLTYIYHTRSSWYWFMIVKAKTKTKTVTLNNDNENDKDTFIDTGWPRGQEWCSLWEMGRTLSHDAKLQALTSTIINQNPILYNLHITINISLVLSHHWWSIGTPVVIPLFHHRFWDQGRPTPTLRSIGSWRIIVILLVGPGLKIISKGFLKSLNLLFSQISLRVSPTSDNWLPTCLQSE